LHVFKKHYVMVMGISDTGAQNPPVTAFGVFIQSYSTTHLF